MSTLPGKEFKVGIPMKCGCAASGTVSVSGGPSLVSCCIHSCTEVMDEKPSLEGRTAVCAYGGREVPSSWDLAFFQYRPNEKHDQYYCGCYGWD